MNNLGRLSRYFWLYTIVSAFLAFLMVITLLPHELLAQELGLANPDIPTVKTLPPQTIKDTSAVLEGYLESYGKGETVEVYFEYGTDSNYGLKSASMPMLNTGDFQIMIADLGPQTGYYIRAVATNSFGESQGEDLTFTTTGEKNGEEPPTPPFQPEPAPVEQPVLENISVTDITVNSALLHATLREKGIEDTVEVSFEYGTDTDFGRHSETIVAESTGEFSINVQGLISSTQYFFRAYAMDSSGTYTSDFETFITLSESSSPAQSEKPPVTSPEPSPSPKPPLSSHSEKVTVKVKPDEESEVTSANGKIKLHFPKGAVDANTDVEISELTPVVRAGILKRFDLNAQESDTSTKAKINQFKKNLTITLTHDPQDLAGMDTDSLQLYYLEEETARWVPVPSEYNSKEMTLTASIGHFSSYSEQANGLASGPGRITSTQVNPHSGEGTFSYPLELPTGPGGFQPAINLTYNTGTIDEMKNKRAAGSWVGIGWNLNLGRISYDLKTMEYYLELNEVSYKLISSDGINYHTCPEEYFRITRNGETWVMWDRSGNYYRFGYSDTSKQYILGSIYYRWDLDLMEDTNDNQATITYVQDIRTGTNGNWVRSAYPETLTYANGQVQVHFILGTLASGALINRGSDGYLRPDNPISYSTTQPAPKIMENRQLDSIEITVNGSLLRKYAFEYTTTSCGDGQGSANYSTDYGGIYYSGIHVLDSITQVGANGTSTLPTMEFTYESKQIFRHTDEGDYSGNPGNPANLHWPYLTQIDSGFGGSVSFTYVQGPYVYTEPPPFEIGYPQSVYDAESEDYPTIFSDNWTRQIIIAKTVHSGVGVDQVTNYSYTTSPVYSGEGWDQSYSGFSEVKEIDGAENYIIHYYYTSETSPNLNGREFRTRWYQENGENDILLKQIDYTWTSTPSGTSQTEGQPVDTGSGATLNSPYGVAVAPDGAVYVISGNQIVKYNSNLVKVTSPFDSITINGLTGIAISSDYVIYVASENNILRYDSSGNPINPPISVTAPWGVAVSGDSLSGYVYVTQPSSYQVGMYDQAGNCLHFYTFAHEGVNTISGYYNKPYGIAVAPGGDYVYVGAYNLSWCYDGAGWSHEKTYLYRFFAPNLDYLRRDLVAAEYHEKPYGVATGGSGSIYVTLGNQIIGSSAWGTGLDYSTGIALGQKIYVSDKDINNVKSFSRGYSNWTVTLTRTDEITYDPAIGSKTTLVEYVYDSYGNVAAEKHHGDTLNPDDDFTIWRGYALNTDLNILDKLLTERVYKTIMAADEQGSPNRIRSTAYLYDGAYNPNTDFFTPGSSTPSKGNLTWVLQAPGTGGTVETYYAYDSFGNKIAEQDPNGNVTKWKYNDTYQPYNTYPSKKIYPAVSGVTLTESYYYDSGTNNLAAQIDANNHLTVYNYDTFKRLIKETKPGDLVNDGTFGRTSGNTTDTDYGGCINLNRFQNTQGSGILSKLELQVNDSTPDGTVRMAVYADNGGTVGNLLVDVGEIPVANGWVSLNTYLPVTSNTYYWLAFSLSADNDIKYQTGTGTNSQAYKTLTYGDFPLTLSGLSYNSSARVMRATVSNTSVPSIEYQYNNWGTLYSQNINTISKIDASNNIWQASYFDGLGRVIQTQAQGNSGHTIIASTTSYNNRGLVEKQYIAQDNTSILTAVYTEGIDDWKYSSSVYDALGRVITQNNIDGTSVSHTYSIGSQTSVFAVDLVSTPGLTDGTSHKKRYSYDAFQRLIKVEEMQDNLTTYATTNYTYDVMGNLTQVVDNSSNSTTVDYDMLSRKTHMHDPDMGDWYYYYDANGNLIAQVDARPKAINLYYDELNRLKGKTYTTSGIDPDDYTRPVDPMSNYEVGYLYDSAADGNYGKGKRTSMYDAMSNSLHPSTYKYDNRGRLIQEVRTEYSGSPATWNSYTTSYTYDGLDRIKDITYPNGEIVTQHYDDRGLPDTLSSDASGVGDLVIHTLYNQFGAMTEMGLGNNTTTNYSYWGIDHPDQSNPDKSYGRLWEIKTQTSGFESQLKYEGSLPNFKYEGEDNRVTITIDHTKVSSNLTQFPLLVHLSGNCGTNDADMSAVFTELGANWQKLKVTQSDETTQLHVEVESWDNVNEEAWLWVSKPGWTISSTTDITLYLYYDSSQPDNTTYVGQTNSTPAETVWDANFMAVYHMNDSDTSHIADSTSHHHTGTKTAANQPVQAAGLSGKAQSFDGNNDYINLGTDSELLITNNLTVESFINTTSAGQEEVASSRSTANGGDSGWQLQAYMPDETALFWAYSSGGYWDSSPLCSLSGSQWTYLAGELGGGYDKVTKDTTEYSNPFYGTIGAPTSVKIGRDGEYSQDYYAGSIDEFRISNVVRSAAWKKATNYTLRDDLLSLAISSPGTTPPSVTTNAASNIDTDSATLNGNLTALGSASSVAVSFEWGTTTSYGNTIDGTPSSRSSTGTFTAGLTDLTSGTYHYRAKAAGDGTDYGEDQEFTIGSSGGDNRLEITIDHTKVTSDLTQFPVLLHLSGDCGTNDADMSAVFTELGADWQKLRVTDASDTDLYVEVESWDAINYEAWLWVSRPGWTVSSTTDTILYLYYDNTQPDNTAYVGQTGSTPGQSVWDSNYKAVYHMNDATSTTIADSKGSHTGTKSGAVESAGQSGKAQYFDGTNDKINLGNSTDWNLAGSNSTFEMSFNASSTLGTGSYTRLWERFMGGSPNRGYFGAILQSGGNFYFSYGASSNAIDIMSPSSCADDTYRIIAIQVNQSTQYGRFYMDGNYVSQNLFNTLLDYNGNLYVGGGYNYFHGLIDEFRISNTNRPDAWIAATNYTLRDNLVSLTIESGPSQSETLYQTQYTWDPAGNLDLRDTFNLQTSTWENEDFTYDFLDRLTVVSSAAYSKTYTNNAIGNLTLKDGNTLNYPTNGVRPHAVSAMGSTNYAYDANGNMTTRGTQTLTWDVENRLSTVTGGASFVYDGDGNRVKKTEGGETILYVNQFYEKNLTTREVTTYYYLGGKLIAQNKHLDTTDTLRYIQQDSLGSTSMMADASGQAVGTIKYFPYGECRNSLENIPTDRLFTGQRLDSTGLYYYNARYYDANIGRFISADPVVPNFIDPQSYNRYSYCVNNPLKYSDPTGNIPVQRPPEPRRPDEPPPEPPVNPNPDPSEPELPIAPKNAETNPLYLYPPIVAVVPEVIVIAGIVIIVGGTLTFNYEYNQEVAASDKPIVEKLILMGYSPEAVSFYMAKRGSMTAGEIIGNEKKGSINREFPNQWRDKTYNEITKAAKSGDKTAQKAKKLLDDGRFDK